MRTYDFKISVGDVKVYYRKFQDITHCVALQYTFISPVSGSLNTREVIIFGNMFTPNFTKELYNDYVFQNKVNETVIKQKITDDLIDFLKIDIKNWEGVSDVDFNDPKVLEEVINRINNFQISDSFNLPVQVVMPD